METSVRITSESEYSAHYPKLSGDTVTTNCTEADEFLNTLFEISPRKNYIFRGQNDSYRPIIATLFRPDFIAKQEIDSWFSNSDGGGYNGDYYDRLLRWEDTIVQGFADNCMKEGIPLPHIPYNEHLDFETEAVSAHFVARNFGIPNRLVDFTRSPVIASWFAAYGVVHSSSYQDFDRIVVWAIVKKLLPQFGFQIISTSWANAQIPQMQRQKAVLIADTKGRDNFVDTGKCQPMEYSLEQYMEDIEDVQVIYPMIHRVTLPKEKIIDLMPELERHELSEINLFPTLDRVAEYTKREFSKQATIAKMLNEYGSSRRRLRRDALSFVGSQW